MVELVVKATIIEFPDGAFEASISFHRVVYRGIFKVYNRIRMVLP